MDSNHPQHRFVEKIFTMIRRLARNLDISYLRLLIPLSLAGIVVEYLLMDVPSLLAVGIPLWLVASFLIWVATKT